MATRARSRRVEMRTNLAPRSLRNLWMLSPKPASPGLASRPPARAQVLHPGLPPLDVDLWNSREQLIPRLSSAGSRVRKYQLEVRNLAAGEVPPPAVPGEVRQVAEADEVRLLVTATAPAPAEVEVEVCPRFIHHLVRLTR